MNVGQTSKWRILRRLPATILGGAMAFGLIGSCNDRMVAVTRYFDPAGTIFANIPGGYFETITADVGDYTIDPTCPIPGACGDDPYQPLGTIYDLDP